MNINNLNAEARLEYFKDLYAGAKSHGAEQLASLEKCMSQYKGSTEIDGSDEAATTVRNITYELIESQVSSDIPQPKADSVCYSERRSRNAESIERLCRALRDRLPYEEMNDIDERYTYIYGGSVWYLEWDNSEEYCGEVGAVRVHCLSPRDFVPQPGIYSIDAMDYCFLEFTTTRGQVKRKYGISDRECEELECDFQYGGSDGEGDAVRIAVCFYRDEDGEVGRFIFSGEVTLSDLPAYYKRRIPFKGGYATVTEEELPEEYRSSPLAPASVPYYLPQRFPIVIRKNTSGERSLFGQSDCDYIRPQQQAINKVESRILQKLIRAGITPIMPEDTTVSLSNSVFGQVIRMKPGETPAQYGTVDTTPNVAQDIAEAERLYDHAKRVAGISDAYQGNDHATAESGYARQLRISQATGRLESKRRMKHTAYAEMDRIIFELYLAFADEPRMLSFKDAYGRVHSACFNRYDFLEYDAENRRFYYDDGYVFSVDLNGGAEYQREALWQRNLENLKAGTLGDPQSAVTLLRYWQCQERAHYPHARENVEYFKQAVEEERREKSEQINDSADPLKLLLGITEEEKN